MRLTDVTTIKNRVGELIDNDKDEIVKLEDLIIFCENVGAINTATSLKKRLEHERYELDDLIVLEGRFGQEEARLISINPELRYPLVSESTGKGYVARDNGGRY